jgi:uroporphyrinogen decarboxylase
MDGREAVRYQRLPREEVVKAVERRHPRRVPLVMAHWWGEGLGEQYGQRLQELSRYPEDARVIGIPKLDVAAMGLSWEWQRKGGHDSGGVIDSWSRLDEFIDKLPDPSQDPRWDQLAEQAEAVRREDTYLIVGWWGLFFETPWGLRGMQNLMTDYYGHVEEIHRLHDALCKVYCSSIRKAAEMMKPDGFWTSDDLGHQTQPMMRPETFDALLKPYYCRIGATLNELGIHWWLHSCGNNAPLMGSLVDAGVDMFHPVQKHTMDERQTAARFGGQIGFWAGFDVQHMIVEGTTDQVRAEVRYLIDTFDRPEGGMVMAAGNGIVSGTPIGNIDAFLDEALRYGTEHRQRFGARSRHQS